MRKQKEETVEKIEIGSNAEGDAVCESCREFYSKDKLSRLKNDKSEEIYLCDNCKLELNKEFEKETQSPNVLLGIIGGLIGGLLGSILWFAVAVILELEIGYISIALGFLVGQGVFLGAGRKRGGILQIIAPLIVIVSILLTEKFLIEFFTNDYIRSNPLEFPSNFYLSVDMRESYYWETVLTPIGVIIYAVGIFIAYSNLRPRKVN